jgi:hypothetical protein
MEVDLDCGGSLDIDELKMLMVLMGEKMDEDEMHEHLDEYDTDKSGNLDFKEFLVMMKGWSTRFGTGIQKKFNEVTKRGPIAKARREFSRWWNRLKLEDAQVQQAKEDRLNQAKATVEIKLKYLDHERLNAQRERELQLREAGLSKFGSTKLPPLV